MNLLKKDIIFKDVNKLKGVVKQLSKYLKNKKIEKIKDILLNLPYAETDRSKVVNLDKLEIGKIQSIKVLVKKLTFPRIRNLPNKIFCEDNNKEHILSTHYVTALLKNDIVEIIGNYFSAQVL